MQSDYDKVKQILSKFIEKLHGTIKEITETKDSFINMGMSNFTL